MTRKEWIEENRPEMIRSNFKGGVFGCPDHYIEMNVCTIGECESNCDECWNKELEDE